jgi:hypothetical protein
VQRDHGAHRKFKFSISPGETLECDGGSAGGKFLVVRSTTQLSKGQIIIGLVPISDARKKAEMQKSKDWVWKVPRTLRELNPCKVVVSPLGEVSEAHD